MSFCGVVVIFLTLVAGILAFVKMILRVSEKRATIVGNLEFGGRVPISYVTTIMGLTVTSIWSVFFAFFLVGMFKDVGLGGLILGYGLAGLVGFALVTCIVTGSVLWYYIW